MNRWGLALELTRQARPEFWVLTGSTLLRILNLSCGAALLAWPAWLLTSGSRPDVVTVGLVLLVVAAMKAVARYGEQVLGHLAAFRTQARLRIRLYDDLVPLAPAITTARGSGDLLTLANDEVNALEVFYAHTIAPTITAVVLPVTGVLVGGWFGGGTVAVVLAIGFLLGGVVVPWLGARASRRASLHASSARSVLAQHMSDDVAGRDEIVSHRGERWRLRVAQRAEAEVGRAVMLGGRAKASRSALAMLWQGATILALLAVAEVPAVLVPIALVPGIAPALASVERLARSLPSALTAAGRLAEVSRITPEVLSPADPVAPSGRSDIELRDVSFRYPGTERDVLDGFSLRVPDGGRVGIVGPSGAGKSTVAHLLTRTFDPQAGQVCLGGVDLRRLDLEEVRRLVRVTDQRGVLLSGTVRSNLLLARPDAEAADLEHACRLACLDRDLAEWPDGLDTVLGEFGTRLSGGQAQRLALARAIVGRPRVLVLDEATSHQDAITQAEIMERLLGQWRGTLIVIAHRDAALTGMDTVVRVDPAECRSLPLP